MNNTCFTWKSFIGNENFAEWHDAKGNNSYEIFLCELKLVKQPDRYTHIQRNRCER